MTGDGAAAGEAVAAVQRTGTAEPARRKSKSLGDDLGEYKLNGKHVSSKTTCLDSRDDYASSREVETAITLMGGGISEEHAGGRARRQLVASSGGHIWVTEAPKNPKKGVIRWRAVQQREGNAVLDSRAGAPI